MYIAGLIKYASSLSTGTLSRVLQSREYSAYNTYSTRVYTPLCDRWYIQRVFRVRFFQLFRVCL